MSMTSRIIEIIREHVTDYETNTSMAEGKENEANGLKSIKRKTKMVEYKLREAEFYQTLYEGQANTNRLAAHKLYDAFKNDFDSDERSEVESLMDRI